MLTAPARAPDCLDADIGIVMSQGHGDPGRFPQRRRPDDELSVAT